MGKGELQEKGTIVACAPCAAHGLHEGNKYRVQVEVVL